MIKYMPILKAYTDYSVGRLSTTAQALYFRLFLINNKAGWPEWFEATNQRLLAELGISHENTLNAAKHSLCECGLIEYKPGNKKHPTQYRLLMPTNAANKMGKTDEAETEKAATDEAYVEVYPEVYPEVKKEPNSAVDKCCEATAGEVSGVCITSKNVQKPTNNLKDIDYDKDNITRARDIDPTPSRFLAFWEAYPKKVSKVLAQRIFLQLKPDAVLFERMMDALSAVKATEQWQKEGGKFVPNPSTWLTQRRWEDELPTAKDGLVRAQAQDMPFLRPPVCAMQAGGQQESIAQNAINFIMEG